MFSTSHCVAWPVEVVNSYKFPYPAEGIEHDYFLMSDLPVIPAFARTGKGMHFQRLIGRRFRPGTIREMM
jgi:hypothetical protein